MFTGIITGLGTLREVQPIGGGQDMRLVIGVAPDFLAGAQLDDLVDGTGRDGEHELGDLELLGPGVG